MRIRYDQNVARDAQVGLYNICPGAEKISILWVRKISMLRTLSFWGQVQERSGASDPVEGSLEDRHSRLQAFGVVERLWGGLEKGLK